MMLGAHLLGRNPAPDVRHIAAYPFAAPPVPPVGIEANIKRPTLSLYDQGQTPKCVAYSTSKVMNKLNGYAFDAAWLYDECKKLDGDPTGDGTNARYACDVLRTQGHWRRINGHDVKAGPQAKHGIAANHWARTVDEVRAAFYAHPQPVLLGIPWHEAWFGPETRNGEEWLQPPTSAGAIVGGHEIGAWACSDRRQAFGLSNTWGHAWPDLVWISYATIDAMLASGDADACVITDLATR